MVRWLGALVFSFFVFSSGCGQHWSYQDGHKTVSLNFEFINSIIIIPVQLNGVPLSFILDTGVKETLLFGNLDSVSLKNVSKIRFQGLGIEDGVDGLLSRENHLSISDSTVEDFYHHLYVITDTSINLSRNLGIPVHGILGSSLFQTNVVRIDYVKKKIHISRRISNLRSSMPKFRRIPITLINNRPYLSMDLILRDRRYSGLDMLVDLGNSDPLMLFFDKIENFKVPEPSVYEYIGVGFNGNIYGKRSRVTSVDIHGFQIYTPFVSFPDESAYIGRTLGKNRMGSIGNQIISRFNVVFDYADSCIYLRPNKNYRHPFNIDMSGLEIRHDGFVWEKLMVDRKMHHRSYGHTSSHADVTDDILRNVRYLVTLLPSYMIHHVREGSPAHRTGLQSGDLLYKVNGTLAGNMSLEKIKHAMQKGDGAFVKVEVTRGEERLKFRFRLKDPIPLNSML